MPEWLLSGLPTLPIRVPVQGAVQRPGWAFWLGSLIYQQLNIS